ncbi:hypothetical protein Ahu01nite_020870 [Winogradskya humida]|uniref:Hydrolase of the HAD superfamily n=2 Tax=Winogradskya humida TaxID=113566 RepID=A0ABQ3ZK78_9ACTN|nr:hypothetical protein Ahu01nite_020870 [Actinoplanes humidus]
MIMTKRALILDIGGVLEITPATGWGERWEHRLGLPAGDLNTRFAGLWHAGSIGTVTEAEVSRRIGDELGIDPGPFMADLWEQYLGTGNEELITYVRGLQGRCRLGILSNSFVGAREREDAAYGFSSLVDEILYSHEIGVEKPDPAAFTAACERLATAPADCLFVDDHAPNIEAARASGLQAVLFEDNELTIARIEEFLHDS